jgi:flavin-dependent dehydrogenase
MVACDVLIVGGGPAGSSCAWGLRASGLRVVIVDRAHFPRDKICGGWVTPLVLQELEVDTADYGCRRTLQPITALAVSALGGPEREARFDAPVSYGIRRCEFDEYLLRRSGAEVREGFELRTLDRDAGHWIVNGEIRAHVLVGAGGHFCPVAKRLGDGKSGEPVVAQEVEFQLTPEQAMQCAIRSETPELYFCRDFKGYGWCFRKGEYLNIGLGRLDGNELPRHVAEFWQWLQRAGKLGFAPPRPHGHAYLLYGYSRRKPVADALLLVGDAAGLAYPQSGEGIRPAIESGLLAAQAIMQSEGDYSAERLQPYAAALAVRFAEGGGTMEALARKLPASVRAALGRRLMRSPKFCREVVVRQWFLHDSDAPLQLERMTVLSLSA